MRTVNLLRAGFGFTALPVAAVGGVSIWGDVMGIEEAALQEARPGARRGSGEVPRVIDTRLEACRAQAGTAGGHA